MKARNQDHRVVCDNRQTTRCCTYSLSGFPVLHYLEQELKFLVSSSNVLPSTSTQFNGFSNGRWVWGSKLFLLRAKKLFCSHLHSFIAWRWVLQHPHTTTSRSRCNFHFKTCKSLWAISIRLTVTHVWNVVFFLTTQSGNERLGMLSLSRFGHSLCSLQ